MIPAAACDAMRTRSTKYEVLSYCLYFLLPVYGGTSNTTLPPLELCVCVQRRARTGTNTKNNKATTRGRTLEYDASSQSTSTTTTTGAHSYNDPFSIQPFVEGMSNYDEYQQAWRLLGFMIDCNTHVNGDDDDDGKSQHSGDEEITEEGCARYVIWAAVSSIFVWCLSLSILHNSYLIGSFTTLH